MRRVNRPTVVRIVVYGVLTLGVVGILFPVFAPVRTGGDRGREENLVRRLLESGTDEQIRQAWDVVLKKPHRANHARLLHEVASHYLVASQPRIARDYLSPVLQGVSPIPPDAILIQDWCLASQGDPQRLAFAEATLPKLLDFDNPVHEDLFSRKALRQTLPFQPKLTYLVARQLELRGDFRGAWQVYTDAASLAPKNPFLEQESKRADARFLKLGWLNTPPPKPTPGLMPYQAVK